MNPGVEALGSGPDLISARSLWFGDDVRLDAGRFEENGFLVEEALKASDLNVVRLAKLCGTMWHPVQNQARSNFKRIYTRPEHGTPFLSSRSMFSLPIKTE